MRYRTVRLFIRHEKRRPAWAVENARQWENARGAFSALARNTSHPPSYPPLCFTLSSRRRRRIEGRSAPEGEMRPILRYGACAPTQDEGLGRLLGMRASSVLPSPMPRGESIPIEWPLHIPSNGGRRDRPPCLSDAGQPRRVVPTQNRQSLIHRGFFNSPPQGESEPSLSSVDYIHRITQTGFSTTPRWSSIGRGPARSLSVRDGSTR